MANLDVAGLITEVKRIAAGGAVVNRGITPGEFEVDSFPELEDSELTKRARVLKTFDCRITEEPARASATSRVCATQLYDVTLRCNITRHVDTYVKTSQSTRDQLLGACWEDVDKIVQALEYPGNVNYNTANGGLVSRCLRKTGARLGRVQLGDTGPNYVETLIIFSGVLRVNAN